jgi:tape measure domain-containing protein
MVLGARGDRLMSSREIIVRLRAEVADYQRAMAAAGLATEAIGIKAKNTETTATTAFGRMVQSAGANSEAWTKVGTTLLVVGTAITGLGIAAAKTGIDYNTLQQTSRAALKTLLGSAEAANAQMDKLDAFARTSPFSKAVFITAQQQLIGFGMAAKNVLPTLDAIQNAVAATGGSNDDIKELTRIIAQVGAAGKITAVDLMQFGQRGVDAATLIGSQMGKTGAQIRDDISAGALGADDAIAALTAGMEQRFGGSAANVKATFAGATDRVRAAWRDLSGELMAPMVGPNGGGFLIDVANGAADAMRSFQKLPEPAKIATESVGGLVGVTALLSGGFLTLAPRIIETKKALETMNVSISAIKTTLGVVGAVLAVATIAFGVWTKSNADAKAKVDDYKASLDQATGALTENTRAVAFNRLQQDGMIDKAKEVGLNLQDVVTAAIDPSSDAYRRLALAMAAAKAKRDDMAKNQPFTSEGDAAARQAGETYNFLSEVLGAADSSGKDVKASQSALADQLKAGVGATESSTTATKKATLSVEDQVTAIGKLITAQEQASGKAQSVRDAQRGFQASIDGVNVSIENQISTLASHYVSQGLGEKAARSRAEAEVAASNKLDISTEAGRANQAALDDVAKSGWAVVTSLQANGASQTDIQAAMGTSRQAFLDAATALGMDKDAAGALADQLGLIPANVPSKVTLDIADAQANVDAIQAKVDKLGQGAYVNIDTVGAAGTYQYLTNIQTIINGINGTHVRVAVGAGGQGGLTFAEGGYTGAGGKYEPAGVVHRGEYVIKADTVSSFGGPKFFDNLNAQRFSSGGMVGGVSAGAGHPVSLDGMRLTGTLDLGGGLTGLIDARVQSGLGDQSSKILARPRR